MNYYDYGYGYGDYGNGLATGITAILAGLGMYLFFMFAVMVFMLVCMWRIFTKAGQAGWKALVPIYNIIVLLQIVELPLWYIALLIIPFANIYAMFKIFIELAHKFGKSTGFGVAMVFFSFICLPILAFGKNNYKEYVGVNNASSMNNNQYQTNNNYVQPNNSFVQPNVAMQPNMNYTQPNVTPNNNINMYNTSEPQPMNTPIQNIYQTPVQPQPPVEQTVEMYQPLNIGESEVVQPIVQPEVEQINVITENLEPQQSVQEPIGQMYQAPIINEREVVQPIIQQPVEQINMVTENLNSGQTISPVNNEPLYGQTNVNPMKKTCPKCGNQVDSETKFCFRCGNQF